MDHNLNLDEFYLDEIIAIESFPAQNTIDITVEDAHMFFLENGIYTHNSGYNQEIIDLDSIADAYAKCFCANFICSLSRNPDEKQANTGKVFIAKNNLGRDAVVYPIFFDTVNTTKFEVLPEDSCDDLKEVSMKSQGEKLKDLYEKYKDK